MTRAGRAGPRHRLGATMKALLASPRVRALLTDPATATPLPDDVGRWLSQLALLHGVPFNNLVADARMLPDEAIRFFFLDQNWLDALIDGALSVVASLDSQHAAMVDVQRARLAGGARAGARRERRRRRLVRAGASPEAIRAAMAPDPPAPANVWSGFLLRSVAVSSWPGLQVKAFADGAGTRPLGLLRLDRPSPSVMIAIFDGIGARFELGLPSQALHFGVLETETPGTYQVPIRGLGGAIDPGVQVPGAYAAVPLRPDARGRRVLDVTALRGAIWSGLVTAYGASTPPPLHPGAFALEMTEGSEQQPFDHARPRGGPADG